MANANCGGDIDVMIAQLTIVLMVNPSHFPDQCCYPRVKLLHQYNLQKYSLVIGSLGFRQPDGTIFSGNTGNCQNNCRIGILPYWLIVEVMLAYISINYPLNFLHLCCYSHGVSRCHRMNAAELVFMAYTIYYIMDIPH